MDNINYPMQVPFNTKALTTLAALSGNGRFPHALLIEGENGIGKKEFATLSAMRALCEIKNSPCGICGDCLRAVRGIHPDIKIYGAEGGEKAYPMDIIREIRSDTHILPNQANKKIYILLNADEMSVKSQNAMLKTIEEPPPHVVFILTCQNKSRFLETILSRVVTITLETIETVDIVSALEKEFPQISAHDILNAAELSLGNIGKAKNILNGDAPHIALSQEIVEHISNRDIFSFNKISYKVCKDKQFVEVFSQVKHQIIKQATNNIKGSTSGLITPLQAVHIADIIDKGLMMNNLNANANLLSVYIASQIFK